MKISIVCQSNETITTTVGLFPQSFMASYLIQASVYWH